jgi:hypothetical protein
MVTECRSFVEPSDKLYLSEVATTDLGPRVAVALSHDSISIYDAGGSGLEQVAQVALPEPVNALVAVPNGWLLFPSLRLLGSDGTLGAPHPFVAFPSDHPLELFDPVGAYGAGGRVLFTWNERDKDDPPDVHAIVVDVTGAIIKPRFRVLPASLNVFDPIAAASDTGFFIGTLDQLVRLDANGAVLGTTTGFPGTPPNPIAVTFFAGFANGTGWYVALGEHRSYLIQQFDPTGARIGGATTVVLPDTPKLNYFSGFSVDGDHLVALAWTDVAPMGTTPALASVMAVQISAVGTVSTPVALGIGTPLYLGKLQRFGSEMLAGWLAGEHAQLARLPP